MNNINPGAIGSNISNAFRNNRDTSTLDRILMEANASEDPNAIDEAMRKVATQVDPQNQGTALQLLQNKQKNLMARSKASAGNPEAQKWAYKELEKKAPLQALRNSIEQLRSKNKSGVTGPIAGRVPSALAGKESDAIRKGIDAEAIQILNVHKSMFPRGLTQGEFNTLSQKLVSSKNTEQANEVILNAYDRLANLQEKKLQAVETAVQQYGFDPMLPFIVSGIQKQYEDQEASENRNLYDMVVGGKSSTESAKESSIKAPENNKKRSLEDIFK